MKKICLIITIVIAAAFALAACNSSGSSSTASAETTASAAESNNVAEDSGNAGTGVTETTAENDPTKSTLDLTIVNNEDKTLLEVYIAPGETENEDAQYLVFEGELKKGESADAGTLEVTNDSHDFTISKYFEGDDTYKVSTFDFADFMGYDGIVITFEDGGTTLDAEKTVSQD